MYVLISGRPLVDGYDSRDADPSGGIGFMVCCKDPERDVREPLRTWSVEEEEKLCRYYNKDVHKASFILPTFTRKALR
jgi:spermidine synthase